MKYKKLKAKLLARKSHEKPVSAPTQEKVCEDKWPKIVTHLDGTREEYDSVESWRKNSHTRYNDWINSKQRLTPSH